MSDILNDPVQLERYIIWAGAICTLAIYTFLYRENVIYRAFEHFYLGLAVGYGIVIVVTEIIDPKWWTPMWVRGEWWWMFAGIVGLMFYFIYSQKHNWISRLAFGAAMGLSVGAMFQDFAGSNFPKIQSSIDRALIAHPGYALTDPAKAAVAPAAPYEAIATSTAINNVIFLIVLLSVMSYFFFSFDHGKHPRAAKIASFGRWMLMFAFGAMFGATVMARMSLLIGRMWFLLHDWLRLSPTM